MSKKTTLYKYLSTKNLKDDLENSHIFLSDGNNLNDPFELLIVNDDKRAVKVSGKRILCLTNSYKNRLMWSHYADYHKGACIAVELDKENLYPVCYTSERVTSSCDIDSIIRKSKKSGKKNLQKDYSNLSFEEKACLIKDKKWMYENEYRMILNDEPSSHYCNVKVVRLYIGVNFNMIDNKEIIDLCRDKGIEIRRMVTSNKRYSLDQIKL